MKIKTFLMILAFSAVQAQAAKVFKTKTATSSVLKKISQELSVLNPYKKTDIQFKEYSFGFKKSLESSEFEQIIKVGINKEYQEEYSRPEFIHIMGLRKKDLHDEMALIVEPFQTYAKVKGLSIAHINDALLKVDHLVSANDKLKVFTLSQGNMFGEGVGVILFDELHNEFLVLERLYQE